MKCYFISFVHGKNQGNMFHKGSLLDFFKSMHFQGHNPVVTFYQEISEEEFSNLVGYFNEINKERNLENELKQ